MSNGDKMGEEKPAERSGDATTQSIHPVATTTAKTSEEKLPRGHWDFLNVPSDEAAACLLYEMTRDCESIYWYQVAKNSYALSKGVDMIGWRGKKELPPVTPEQKEQAQRVVEHIKSTRGLDWVAFGDRAKKHRHTHGVFFYLCMEFINQGWPPWTELAVDTRVEFTNRYDMGGPVAVHTPSALGLEDYWRENVKKIEAIRASVRPDGMHDYFTEAMALSDVKAEPFYKNGTLYITLGLNLEDYTNAQLRDATARRVAELLAKRPENCPEPRKQGKGKAIEVAAALRGLSCLRALAVYSYRHPKFPRELSELHPSAPEHECYRLANLARDRFHQFFPFLPEGEEPVSYALWKKQH